MRLPGESSSSWVHIAFASFTYASLVAWSESTLLLASSRAVLADLAAMLKVSMEGLLKEARETQDAQLFARPSAQARQNVALQALNRVTKEAQQIVAMRIGNHSNDDKNVRFFLPNLVTGIMKMRLAKRPNAVIRAAGRLGSLPDFDERAELITKLNDAATHAQSMIDVAADAYSGWETERSEEIVAKGQLRLDLQRVYGGLTAEFPGQKDFCESFFLRSGKPSEGERDDDAGDTDDDDVDGDPTAGGNE